VSRTSSREVAARLRGAAAGLGTIRARLLAWFLVLSIGSVAVVAALGSWLVERNLERILRENLESIAFGRVAKVELIIDSKVMAVSALARDPSLAAMLESTGASEGGSIAAKQGFLGSLAEGLEFSSLLLVDAEGRVVAEHGAPAMLGTSLREAPWEGSPLAASFGRARSLLQADVSAPQLLSGRTRPAIFVTGPVLEGARVAGVLVAQVDERPIDLVLLDPSGLGETGRAIAVHQEGASLVVAAPFRGGLDAAGRRRLARGAAETPPFARAARGELVVGYGVGLDAQPVIGAWCYLPSVGWALSVQQDVREAFAPAREQRTLLLLVAALLALPVAAAATWVARGLSRPIGEAVEGVLRVADGDLTRAVSPQGSGEVRDLLEGIGRMRAELAGLLGGIRGAARGLVSMAGEVRSLATGQQEVAESFSGSASEIAAAVQQMSATSRQLSASAGAVGATADDTAGRAESGQGGLDRLREAMQGLSATSGDVSGRLAEIRERAGRVGTVIGTITRVANRTNLLSINAAIEAEKAGAEGRGFQVVAAEIARLADETASAALEVEEIIAGMQSAVAEGARAMTDLASVVERGVSTSEGIGGDLARILEAIGSLRASFEELRSGIEAQSHGASQINDAMRQLVDGAGSTRDSVDRLRDAGDRLERSAVDLDRSVERFRLPGG